MLVKFLRTYTGGGLGSINYLLNERKAAGTARVIKGDENLTRAIIKGITYKQRPVLVFYHLKRGMTF